MCLAVLTTAAVVAMAAPAGASAATYPAGFNETTVFSGLTNPTAVRFAPDGRVFVAEKSGLIRVGRWATRSTSRAARPTRRTDR